MMRRVLVSGGIAAVVAVLTTLPVSTQAPGRGSIAATTPALVVTAFNGEPAPANWTALLPRLIPTIRMSRILMTDFKNDCPSSSYQ